MPELHRTTRAAATWAAGTLYTLGTMAVAFVTTPLLLRYLGAERMGAFRALTEWVGYLALIDLGIIPALGVMLVQAHAKASVGNTAAVFRGGVILLAIIACVTMVAGVGLAFAMPRLVPVSSQIKHELVVSTLVSVALSLSLPFQLSRIQLEVQQRGYWTHFALLSQAVIAAVLGVMLARRGFGLVAQSGALLVGTIIGTAVCLGPTWRWYVARPATGDADLVTVGEMWRLGWPLAVAGLSTRVNWTTDSLVTGYVLGPTAVFQLFVTQRVVGLFGGQVNAVVSASWAALANMRMTGQSEAFISGTVELTSLVVGVGTALTGTVAAFDRHFVRLWVGEASYGGDLLAILTASALVMLGAMGIYGYALDMAGETASRVHVSIISSVLNIALSVSLTKLLGLTGVVLGTLLATGLTDAWYCPFLVSRRLGVPGRLIVNAVWKGLLRGLPWSLLAVTASHLYQPRTWLTFLVEAAVGGTLSLAYTWMIVLTAQERQRWVSRASRILPWLPQRRMVATRPADDYA